VAFSPSRKAKDAAKCVKAHCKYPVINMVNAMARIICNCKVSKMDGHDTIRVF
jgi:hypothetical protein